MPANPIITIRPHRHAHPDEETVKAVRLDRLHLPIHICLGAYEAATEVEIHDHIADLTAELKRREELRTP